jgi:hypothetical protein
MSAATRFDDIEGQVTVHDLAGLAAAEESDSTKVRVVRQPIMLLDCGIGFTTEGDSNLRTGAGGRLSPGD